MLVFIAVLTIKYWIKLRFSKSETIVKPALQFLMASMMRATASDVGIASNPNYVNNSLMMLKFHTTSVVIIVVFITFLFSNHHEWIALGVYEICSWYTIIFRNNISRLGNEPNGLISIGKIGAHSNHLHNLKLIDHWNLFKEPFYLCFGLLAFYA